jgi:hypothetical protein
MCGGEAARLGEGLMPVTSRGTNEDLNAAGFVGSCPGLSRLASGSGGDRSTGRSGQAAAMHHHRSSDQEQAAPGTVVIPLFVVAVGSCTQQ